MFDNTTSHTVSFGDAAPVWAGGVVACLQSSDLAIAGSEPNGTLLNHQSNGNAGRDSEGQGWTSTFSAPFLATVFTNISLLSSLATVALIARVNLLLVLLLVILLPCGAGG